MSRNQFTKKLKLWIVANNVDYHLTNMIDVSEYESSDFQEKPHVRTLNHKAGSLWVLFH